MQKFIWIHLFKNYLFKTIAVWSLCCISHYKLNYLYIVVFFLQLIVLYSQQKFFIVCHFLSVFFCINFDNIV